MGKPRKPKRTAKPTSKPLSATVTRGGVLTIEIGIDTLAHAALLSPFADTLADEKTGRPGEVMPDRLFKITDPRGFANDIVCALREEAEDGSSLLTGLLDDASRKAIDDGSEFFMGIDEEP